MDTALDLADFVSPRALGSQKGPEFSSHIQESPGRRKCPLQHPPVTEVGTPDGKWLTCSSRDTHCGLGPGLGLHLLEHVALPFAWLSASPPFHW